MGYTVYLRTNLINGKQYVGQSGNIKERNLTWKSYKTPYSRYIDEDKKKFGIDAFSFATLAECETQEEAWELEQRYIAELGTKYPAGYNISDGGPGCKGNIPWNKGVPMTKEVYEKCKPTMFKKGVAPWLKGKHHTEETKKMLSQILLNNKATSKEVAQYTLDWELIATYPSASEAARQTGFKSRGISRACAGGHYQKGQWYEVKTYKKFHWKYI